MRFVRALLALLITTIMISTLVALRPAQADSYPPPEPRGSKYVALGDSYSSGAGLEAYDNPNGCERSVLSFPRRLSRTGPASARDLHFVACSGAQTKDVFGWNHGEAPQINAVTSETGLITLTIGGNDIRFAEVVTDCAYIPAPFRQISDPWLPAAAKGGPGCRTSWDTVVRALIKRYSLAGPAVATNSTGNRRLVDVLRELHNRTPKGEIRVALYPQLVGTTMTNHLGCHLGTAYSKQKLGYLPVPIYISQPDVLWLRDKTTDLNIAIARSVGAARAEGIPVRLVDPPFDTHGICDSRAPWIEKLAFASADDLEHPSSATLHPTIRGARAYADAFDDSVTTTMPPQITGVRTFRVLADTNSTLPLTTLDERAGRWRITGGALPEGFSLVASTFSGHPSAPGTYDLTLSFTDAQGRTDNAGYRIEVRGPQPPEEPVDPDTSTTGLNYAAALACTDSNFCIAKSQLPYTGRWDGVVWSDPLANTPYIGSGPIDGVMSSLPQRLACASASACFLAQDRPGSVNEVDKEGIWRSADGGGTWTQESDVPEGMRRISCATSSYCVANSPRSTYTYDGNRWQRVGTAGGLHLERLSCPAVDFCAGYSETGETATFDGSTWTVIDSDSYSEHPDVGCMTKSSCFVLTEERTEEITSRLLHWDGSTWTAATPFLGNGEQHARLACNQTQCVALERSGATFVWDGIAWSGRSRAEIEPYSASDLECPSENDCFLLTRSGDVHRWDGSTWRPMAGNKANVQGEPEIIPI